jgi:protein O-mannosyl-transferase
MPQGDQLENMAVGQPSERLADPDSRSTVAGLCVLLAMAVLLVFGRTVWYQFVCYDDDLYFDHNPHIQSGLTWCDVIWAFRTNYANNWHPLTWLSLMLDVELFGASPAGPHLTNVLLHAVNAMLLFLLLRRLTGAQWRSAFVAAVFAIHPLRVESVAWVAERKDVLSGLFFMLTLWAWACYAESQSRAEGRESRAKAASALDPRLWTLDYWLVLLFFALGLMSKPILVTVPFVLLLLDWWPLRRFGPSTRLHLVLEKLPFLALSLVSSLATVWAQQGEIVSAVKLPVAIRLCNAVVSYVTYLAQMFYPVRLAVFYPYSADEQLIGNAPLALVLLAGISAGVFMLRRKQSYLLVGWLWYLGMLVPAIGLVQVGAQAHADRYTYLPQIGVCIIAAWAVTDLLCSWRYGRRVLRMGAFGVMVALMTCSWKQTSYWRDSESLWTHTLACTSGNFVGHNNLGNVLADQGRYAGAVEHYLQALAIKPNYAEAHYNLGNALALQGRYAEAIGHFQQALQIRPDDVNARNSLDAALMLQAQPAKGMEK